MKIRALIAAIFMFFGASIAAAAPVVTFTTSGSAGSWLLDFSVTNNLGGTNDIYFFGVDAPTINLVSAPDGWNTNNQHSGWNNAYYGYGGSSTVYEDVWCCTFGGVKPGETLSGFTALYNTVAAPTNVSWFAYAYGGTYTGADNFYFPTNPGFEGVATAAAPVPEPETYAMLMVGLGLLGFTARRRKDTTV